MIREVSVADRFELLEGTVYVNGVQAIVRAIFDDARRRRGPGSKTGTFVSGYPGSPLGGMDAALLGQRRLMEDLDVVFRPGVNEELAATAVLGATKRDVFDDEYDGVTGVWYGKCNGVDRCVDIFKYGNYGGLGKNDGVLVVAGDDPRAKSSGIPGESEHTLAAAGIPVLAPATIGEIHRFALHGLEMSRRTGCWVGLKVVTDQCDGGATIDVAPGTPEFADPGLGEFTKLDTYAFFGEPILDAERDLFGARHEAVKRYARANALDRIVVSGPHDSLGIVSSGKTFADLQQALADLGLDEDELRRRGIRLIKVGLRYPLDEAHMREMATGLSEIFVIEEKRGFLETQLRAALYGTDPAPIVTGKADEHGAPLIPVRGELDADAIASVLRRRMGLSEERKPAALPLISVARRMPNYCSGCPHSRGTVTPAGLTVLGGIGCHSIGLFMTQPERQYAYNVQMGGEGVTWVGAEPFVRTTHIVQNVGDGTYFHSASLAIRQCVDAGVDITFRVLYNGYVSMTGGQRLAGTAGVIALTRELAALGVGRIVLVTEEVSKKDVDKAVEVVGPEHMTAALSELANQPGVTVLIHDRECALERRRGWRRSGSGPTTRIMIHEEVCEGCGDCGAKSNCPSLEPVNTDLGRKTRIQQSSCAVDRACLAGDCPSFVSVTTRKPSTVRPAPPPAMAEDELPEPTPMRLDDPARIYSVGIGGTGVVTVNIVLSFAALMDGLEVLTLDQTGLAQKGGPVASHLLVGRDRESLLANKIGEAKADVYLAFDPLEAVGEKNLSRVESGRTVGVIDSTVVPTGEMVRDVTCAVPDGNLLVDTLRSRLGTELVEIPAGRMAMELFGDHMKANFIATGAAVQAGMLPMRPKTIESAIRLNGVDVEANLQAFRYGRLWVSDRDRVEAVLERRDLARPRAEPHRPRGWDTLVAATADYPEELRTFVQARIGDLARYQDRGYAADYAGFVDEVWRAESSSEAGDGAATRAVALHLYRLMAYKDEYEVARLLTDGSWIEGVRATFGADARVSYHLSPPLLRRILKGRKVRLGRWVRPFLRVLARMRWVRGRWLDPFGKTATRRLERRLPEWYRSTVRRALPHLDEAPEAVQELIRSPEAIRGYESLKVSSAGAVMAEVEGGLARLEAGSPQQVD